MEDFFSAIQQRGRFSAQQLAAIAAITQVESWSAGSCLLAPGTISSTCYFVRSGALVSSATTEDNTQVVQDLFLAGDWVLEHKSFTGRIPSKNSITAFSDCITLALSIDAIHELIAVSPAYLQLGSILHLATSRQELLDNYPTPEERYRQVLAVRPELLHHFPLKLLASYLRMTPETLSRVRKRITGQ
ncbi:MAG: Crp/Fnr family transcriptional regulator [Bacteroidota bacterium]